MRARTVAVSGLAALVAVLGGGGSASAGGGCMHGTHPTDGHGTVVELIDLCFSPTVLHVEPGTEVTWVNRDDTSHEVTGVGGTWGTFDDLGLNDRVSYTFADDGVYVYSCFIHPGMVGAIVVGSGAGAAGMSETSVTGGGVTDATVAASRSTGPSATDGNALGALLTGGTAGLVIGGGLAAIALRRRREAAAVDRVAG
jgi:plastocyanin